MFAVLITAMSIIIFIVYSLYNNTTNISVSEAIATQVETLANEPVIVKGIVLDEGIGINLRRDPDQPNEESDIITPGTEYTIQIEEVLQGDVQIGDEIYIAIQGGEYKGERQLLKSKLEQEQSYLFFLSESFQGTPQYYGRFLPHIFQFPDGQVLPIVTEYRHQDMFEDADLTESQFYEKLERAIQK